MRLISLPIAIASVAQLALAGAAPAADAPSFEQLDVNKDGVLSRSEAAKLPSMDFSAADKNRDGALSRSEYEAAIK
jgi:hypothetical protein